MNSPLGFDEPMMSQRKTFLHSEDWNIALDTFSAGNFKNTVIAVLNYIDPSIAKTRGNQDLTELIIPHGSIKIKITIRDNQFSISAPFVKIPEQNILPLLRQITELNFSILCLSKLILKGSELHFEYNCPIELCEPYKIYYVLREICSNADYYDDIFIEKFGVSRLEKMEVIPYSAQEVDLGWAKYQQYLKDSVDYCTYFESKRMPGFCWDTLFITFMKLDYVLDLQGFLDTEITRGVRSLYGDASVEEKVASAKKVVQQLIAFPKEKFAESFYKVFWLIPPKTKSNLISVKESFKQPFENATKEMSREDYLGAAFTLQVAVYNVFDRSTIPAEVSKILVNSLKNSTNQSWKDAADILYDAINSILAMETLEEEISL